MKETLYYCHCNKAVWKAQDKEKHFTTSYLKASIAKDLYHNPK